ncbi:MAG TPA: tetratricopeptide repeat protein [Streptosporangiaceae bacterium]|jgi:predicted ATPase/class 3 adenylate cyclase
MGDMGELPAGTVTMLFSDIEGSTALLSRLGDRYGETLSAQRALLRAAFTAGCGHELGTEGDSFFVVFGSASDAVRCCVAAQRALAGHAWPDGVAVRVRMGLHSGEPARHEGGYIGMDVHRAARIAAAAHGGQVVLSEATRLLAGPRLPAGASVLDLGFHRLKDIGAAEHIYQLVAPGLPERFPPLKSLGAPSSLPAPMTVLVGRDEELARLRGALTQPEARLVTLTGPGGVGKTRLALAAAASVDAAFSHGVFFVPLAAVRDPDVMWKTIADSLDTSGEGSAADAVTRQLSGRRALLVLDNLEQLAGADDVTAALLAAVPGLTVLATSRRPLHLPGEHEHPVPPLALPDGQAAEQVAASGAAALFAQQAQLVRPGFTITPANAADVAAICQRLDGLPLAIELAASRVKLLGPGALRARLGSSLTLTAAGTGRPHRQQTLRDTIAWSYDLLTSEAASMLRKSAVFAGGCDLDAFTAVARPADGTGDGPGDVIGHGQAGDPLSLVAGLLDDSLITVTDGADGEPRVGMLETIREYALDRLEAAGEAAATRDRHASYYADLACRADRQLGGPAQLSALDGLEAEHDNLRAALSWTLTPDGGRAGQAGRAATGLRLVHALISFWFQHGHATEGRQWLRRATALAPDEAGEPSARITHGLGMLLSQQGELPAALALFERSLAIWRDVGNRDQQANELNSIGATQGLLGQHAAARSSLTESIDIAREIGSDRRLAAAYTSLGQVECYAGDFGLATEALEHALALDERQGDLLGAAIDRHSLAAISLRAGQPRQARDQLAASFDYMVNGGNADILATGMELTSCVAAELRDGVRAARLAGAAETVRQLAGMPIPEPDAALLERCLAPARAAMSRQAWEAELTTGRGLTQQQAIGLLTSVPAAG